MFNSQIVGAVITAAGRGERMGGIDKIFAPLGNATVLEQVVSVFQDCEAIDKISVILSPHNLEHGRRLLNQAKFAKVISVATGGERRQDSVLRGLNTLTDCCWIVIHDGARPLVTRNLITDGLQAAQDTGAATAAVPVSDTIKAADVENYVKSTLDRSHLWAVQTPQVFRRDIITEAHRKAVIDATDDAALAEALGVKVKLYMGAHDNIKLTTPSDLDLSEMLWRRREG
ncbi:MAG: 2-C-methyl-D-erythritol 4-phosphate cytidylyltransferase [Dehalococcoidia bacterium]|nr:2-C-methyl-D-erythritol 4-phosphate cytidylyltransferase [Dehalococcoidia bacterium]